MMSECEIASVINMSEPTPLDAAGENWSRRATEKGMLYDVAGDVADGVASTMLFLMIKERESTD